MKSLLLTFFVFFSLNLFGQKEYNTIFFTENGEQFWVIMNGVRQNMEPETNVKVTGLNAPMYKLRIIFKDKELGMVDKNLFMPEQSAEINFIVKKNRKGAYVAKYFSATPIKNEPTTPAQQVIVFQASNDYPADPWQTTTTTTTMSSTTIIKDDSPKESVGISVGGLGTDIDINVNVNDGNINNEIRETTVISSTTTTTTNAYPTYEEDVVVVNNRACRYSMSDGDFQRAKSSIDSKTFADDKVTMAKQISDSNCLTSRQVAQVVSVLEYENDKLIFAKHAYERTFDKGNYFMVNDAFEYSSSIEELNEYIKK